MTRTGAPRSCASSMKDIVAHGARLVATAVLATALLGFTADQAFGGAVISNGTVALGVNDAAQLNFGDSERFVGVTYEATGNDGTRAARPSSNSLAPSSTPRPMAAAIFAFCSGLTTGHSVAASSLPAPRRSSLAARTNAATISS